MGPEMINDRYIELSANTHQVASAWLLAAVVVTLLMTVVAPWLVA
jgi:hypothetical protein